MDNELKRSEIQEKLGLRNGEYFRKNYLMPSIEVGIVEMTIPDKPNSSKQRYRLTEKGKALKSEIEQLNNKK
jgi:ATP-dependent DNA helicase RecG